VIIEIVVPAPNADARSAYLEAREKQSFDWPLVSVSTVVTIDHGQVARAARIVMGAVAPIPWRAPQAEQVIVGSRVNYELATRAAEAALAGATPLADNAYKVPIAKALVRRAILRASDVAEEPA
jgi:xanthine dehydrogenase YagS FAD-binding subunit